jgi:hypothetical protein
MENLDQIVLGKEHSSFQAWTRLGIVGILKWKTSAERLPASVYASGAQQFFDAKGD